MNLGTVNSSIANGFLAINDPSSSQDVQEAAKRVRESQRIDAILC